MPSRAPWCHHYLEWFLQIVAIKLIHHIEKCAGTPEFARPAKPYKCHHEPCGAIEYAFKMVLMNCCYQIDPSYRKVCWYPHALKNY